MRPLPNEDTEQFARRMTEIAWSNGAYARLGEIERLRARVSELEDIIAGKKPMIDVGES